MNNIGYQYEYEFVSVTSTNKFVSNIGGWARFEQCQSPIFLRILSKGNIHIYHMLLILIKDTLVKYQNTINSHIITHFSQYAQTIVKFKSLWQIKLH